MRHLSDPSLHVRPVTASLLAPAPFSEAEKAAEWVQTPEGQAAIAESLQEAKELAEEFKKAQQIDPAIWDKEVR